MGSGLSTWIASLSYAEKLALASVITLAFASSQVTENVAIWIAIILALIVWGLAVPKLKLGS